MTSASQSKDPWLRLPSRPKSSPVDDPSNFGWVRRIDSSNLFNNQISTWLLPQASETAIRNGSSTSEWRRAFFFEYCPNVVHVVRHPTGVLPPPGV
mmetsp:Transcript_2352/g.8821  ORF Transcript_2352/g.8821 Transcript_2352/m.8821 type:complete len:96 (-) Transcript_2352:10945-11232(-)